MIPRPNAAPQQQLPDLDAAIGLVHGVAKELDWIRSLASRLCGRVSPPALFSRDIEVIRDLSTTAARRMHGFLDSANPDRSSHGSRATSVGIVQVLNEATEQLRGRAPDTKVMLSFDEELLGTVVPAEIFVAIVAVLENAVDFNDSEKPVSVKVTSDGDRLAVLVKDFGAGMSPEVLGACRDRGFTTRRNAGGHGFGLYAAAKLLNRCSGELLVESELGIGTTVALLVPHTSPRA